MAKVRGTIAEQMSVEIQPGIRKSDCISALADISSGFSKGKMPYLEEEKVKEISMDTFTKSKFLWKDKNGLIIPIELFKPESKEQRVANLKKRLEQIKVEMDTVEEKIKVKEKELEKSLVITNSIKKTLTSLSYSKERIQNRLNINKEILDKVV